MKRQTVMVATFLIAVFATATIFAEVSAAQQPLAPTAKILKKDNQNLRGYYPYRPPYWRPYRPYLPYPIYRPIFPPIIPIFPPIYWHPPWIYRPVVY
ncbi:MAG TPA: hypothetical protein VEG44_00965 [Candidatus Acidoferrales bacterium]|nr:hypothetical protein [Candidatus Acidoferrales bacterium]